MNGKNSLFRGKLEFFNQNNFLKHRNMNFLVVLNLTPGNSFDLKACESCKAQKSPRHASVASTVPPGLFDYMV